MSDVNGQYVTRSQIGKYISSGYADMCIKMIFSFNLYAASLLVVLVTYFGKAFEDNWGMRLLDDNEIFIANIKRQCQF